MRRTIKIPRILKINWVKDLTISVVFNNGESRIIDFQKVLKEIGLLETSPAWKLTVPIEFAMATVGNNTLSWDNVDQYISKKDGKKIKVPFEIGADTLLKYSSPEESELSLNIGKVIKENRLKSGLTQQELATKSGTTRNYISRIENDHSDIELGTLRKIIETGLGKKMDIKIH